MPVLTVQDMYSRPSQLSYTGILPFTRARRKGRSGLRELTAGSGHTARTQPIRVIRILSIWFRTIFSGSCFTYRVSGLPFNSTSARHYDREKTGMTDTSRSLYENRTQRSRPLEKTHHAVQPWRCKWSGSSRRDIEQGVLPCRPVSVSAFMLMPKSSQFGKPGGPQACELMSWRCQDERRMYVTAKKSFPVSNTARHHAS
jgi:hypothetical protein